MRFIPWLLISIFMPLAAVANAQEINWQKVDDAFGRKPAVSGDVHRYGFPRTDLSVTLDGVTSRMAAFIRSTCRAAIPSPKAGCR